MKKLAIILIAAFLILPFSAQATSDSYLIEGGLAGLAVGGGAGVGLGYGICGEGKASFCTGRAAGMILFGTGMAVLGFASGALIGYHYKKEAKAAVVPTFILDPESGIYALGAGMNF